jgi:hypothetical protein
MYLPFWVANTVYTSPFVLFFHHPLLSFPPGSFSAFVSILFINFGSNLFLLCLCFPTLFLLIRSRFLIKNNNCFRACTAKQLAPLLGRQNNWVTLLPTVLSKNLICTYGTIDLITRKTPNSKCRLYWCLIEFIDWRYSQSCWYFRPLF